MDYSDVGNQQRHVMQFACTPVTLASQLRAEARQQWGKEKLSNFTWCERLHTNIYCVTRLRKLPSFELAGVKTAEENVTGR